MRRFYNLILLSALLLTSIPTFATIYYVNVASNTNVRTRQQARSITTPWKRIQTALDSAAVGDTVWVVPGTYAENDTIKKSVTLLGNGGSGDKPIVQPPLVPGANACLTIRARNVTVRNFRLDFNQIFCVYGINAQGQNVWHNLVVTDCQILSKGTGAPCLVYNSYGIYAQGGQDSLTVQRCIVGNLDFNTNCVPGRAIWISGSRALIGGPNLADSNVCAGFYGIQTAGPQGNWRVLNNKLYGIGLLFNSPAGQNTKHQIQGNTFISYNGFPLIACLEIRANTVRGCSITVKGNKFMDYGISGIFSGRSKSIIIDSNEFFPGNPNAVGVLLNTKYQTSGTGFNAFKNDAVIKGNKFNALPGNAIGSYGIGVFNHNAVAGDTSFANMTFGGPGRDANWFSRRLLHPVYLDSNTRNSVTVSEWGTYPITPCAPVKANINAIENLFELASGQSKRPVDMTMNELFEVEARLKHRTHDSRLGFITLKANNAYVSYKSFSRTFATAPSVSRALTALNDGGILNIQPDTLSEVVTNTKAVTINGKPNRTLVWPTLLMTTPGKNLTINNNLSLNSLTLNNGIVDMTDYQLTLRNGSNLFGGNATSFVAVMNGQFVRKLFTADSLLIPIGFSFSNQYAPIKLKNLNATRFDTLTASLRAASALPFYFPSISGTVNGHAGVQWFLDNTTPLPTLDAELTLGWPTATEVNGPLSANTRIMGYNGVGWKRYYATYSNRTASITGLTSLGAFAVTSDPRPVVLATGVSSRFLCAGRDSLNVQALSTDTFNLGNTFTYELSDAAGSFANPIQLGTFSSRLATTRKYPLPAGMQYGNNYRVRVRSSNPAIVGDSSLTTISLDSIPAAQQITVIGNTTLCLGDSVVLSAPTGYPYYQWSNGATTRNLTVRTTGTFNVRVINLGQCSSPVSPDVNVLVTAFSQTPTISVLQGSDTFCEGDSIVLAAPAGFNFYRWSNGATTQTITVKNSGVINVRVGQTSTCLSDTAASNVVVKVTPKPVRPTINRLNLSDTLLATAGGSRYEWFYNGSRIAASTSILRVNRSGNYQVIMVQNGCKSDTSTVYSIILEAARLMKNADLTLYPNPTSENVTLVIPRNGFNQAHIRLLDALGRPVMDGQLQDGNGEMTSVLEVAHLPKGIYFVETILDGQRIIKRLTKE